MIENLEPLSREWVVQSLQAAQPKRAEYVKEVIERLWDVGLCDWLSVSVTVCETVHRYSRGRLSYTWILDGFRDGSSHGIIAWRFCVGEAPLAKFMPALFGNVTGGLLAKQGMRLTTVEIMPGGTLAKVAGAELEDPDLLMTNDVENFARRMLAELGRVQHQTSEPARPGLMSRLFGRAEVGQA